MKRKMTLWVMAAILGIWFAGANLGIAENAEDTSKDKPAATDKANDDDGSLKVDWGDDDKKDDSSKDKPKTESEETGKTEKKETPADDAGDKDKPAEAKKEKESDAPKDSDKDEKEGEKPKESGDDQEAEKEKEVVVLESLEGFYADLAKSVEMPEDQQRKLVSIQDMVKKKVELQARKDEKEIEHLQKRMAKEENEKRAKKYQDKIDAIEAKSKNIEKAGHQMALKTLKGDQIQKWNQSLVWSKIEPDMNMLSISPEQRKKAQEVCGELVAKYKTRALPENAGDKLRMMAAKKLLKEVLEPEQAKEYKRYLSEQMQSSKDSKNSR